MASIQLLPEELIDQIAAGEVVERPASVVKELCENALDAGARQIAVEIQEGGTRLVQVSDDGGGMSLDDARRSLLRHATSKLRDAAGLNAIATMGFRGEALTAIASVSRFTLTTRAAGALGAVRLKLEGGGDPTIEEVGAPLGTRVEVQDLFFNTPARRKFLKRVQTETQRAVEVVAQLMLARPDVGFTFSANGKRLLTSSPGADPRDRVALALGRDVHAHLVPIEGRRGEVAVTGFVTSPDYSGTTSQRIHIFVNRRAIRDRSLVHAVGRAFANLLPPGRYPAAVVFIGLPLERVDVNVHPQKLEVRFAEPRDVAEAVVRVISDALRPAPWLAGRAGPACGRG
jgi:DNA mismatch repair protein MutL